ncbi:MAG: hypothetical protein H7326_04260 [Bdellovibrionaceae bacterium]|nr:hypothetical protein [Pseudobdellovibrionaceae bacterium]
MTLVLSAPAAWTAPVVDHSPAPIEMSPKEPASEIPSDRKESRDWSLRTGFLGGALNEVDKAEQLYFYGVRYTLLRETLRAWDLEITTARKNFLHLKVAKKFYFTLETVTLPYYKFGAGDLVDSSENLASIFNFKKIQATAAIGLDDLFSWDQRLQGEIAVSYAIIGPQFEMSLGFAF